MLTSRKRRKKLQAKLDKYYDYRSYADEDVQVLPSKAAGYGLHAARSFLPGELIIEVRGQLVRNQDCGQSHYVMELNDKWCLEPAVPAAFLNHSCNPNSELVELTKYSLGLVAICNIQPGVEIVFDYQWPADDWVPRCSCGAPNCRGWIVARQELRKMKALARKRERKGRQR